MNFELGEIKMEKNARRKTIKEKYNVKHIQK